MERVINILKWKLVENTKFINDSYRVNRKKKKANHGNWMVDKIVAWRDERKEQSKMIRKAIKILQKQRYGKRTK